LVLLIIAIAEIVLGAVKAADSLSPAVTIAVDLLVAAGEIAVVAASLAITVKRLHDRDKSAWWLLALYVAIALLAGLAVYIGVVANTGVGATADYAALLFRVCLFGVLALLVWLFVELGCRRGSVGTNRYGADPLSPFRPWRTGLTGIDR
jgi:uncharacterized membrane protein YhaH (DUF805 family)